MGKPVFRHAAGLAVAMGLALGVAEAASDPLVQPLVEVAKNREPVLVRHYYWLGPHFSAIRFGEYKYMTVIAGDVPTDYFEGGFGTTATQLTYGAFYNLWLDPKETRNVDMPGQQGAT